MVFGVNAVAIIPLASLLSHATESVASRMGDTVGALMNVTFGNAVELIIFMFVLAVSSCLRVLTSPQNRPLQGSDSNRSSVACGLDIG